MPFALTLRDGAQSSASSGAPEGRRPLALRRPGGPSRRVEGGWFILATHRNGFRRCANRDILAQSPCTNASFFFRLHPLI